MIERDRDADSWIEDVDDLYGRVLKLAEKVRRDPMHTAADEIAMQALIDIFVHDLAAATPIPEAHDD